VHPALRPAYSGVGYLARALAAAAPDGGGKFLRTLRARRGIDDRYREWAGHRDSNRPLLWMHAPSVGEGLQARPVLRLIRSRRPDVQLAYTHFSPSAERFARGLGADFTDYLPFDTATDSRTALDSIQPSALVFAKLDLWPILVEEAASRGVRLGMISATLAARSGRGSRLGRALLGDAYGRLDAVGAIDEADAERLVTLGVREEVIRVTGDTRYDQVWERAQGVDRATPMLAALAGDRPTLVAGSTWPADERVLLPAFERARASDPRLRLIIAPHEPHAAHVDAILAWARRAGVAYARLGDEAARRADVIVVDRVGLLGDLYAVADFAYVGGGFHRAGLHSVLEPAAFGMPVIFGPRTGGSRDAERLLARGGGARISSSTGLAGRLEQWRADPAEAVRAGAAARATVADGLGAADATCELVMRLLPT
jgi:3-deoxy-D-manno-octulosonic-acid transferase